MKNAHEALPYLFPLLLFTLYILVSLYAIAEDLSWSVSLDGYEANVIDVLPHIRQWIVACCSYLDD